MTRARRRRWASAWTLARFSVLAACATTGDPGQGGQDPPSAGVGPFRELSADEVRGVAPFVLDDPEASYREPAVLQHEGATLLYAAARAGGEDVIVRSRALDHRTFFGTSAHFGHQPPVVLAPDAPWEEALSGPFALRVGGEIFLYYAGAEGIGVARSVDGLTFAKEPGPVLGTDATPGSWESSPPRAPTVFALPDGRLRMLYAAGAAIGEAESADGLVWRRLGGGPALAPAAAPPPGALRPGEKPPFDTAAVGDPCAVTRTTPAGRFHVRVLYTGTDEAGATAIGFAARYGEDGALERQPVPVASSREGESAPALLDLGDRSLLYAQRSRQLGSRPRYPAIAASFAPANLTLEPPADFPDRP